VEHDLLFTFAQRYEALANILASSSEGLRESWFRFLSAVDALNTLKRAVDC